MFIFVGSIWKQRRKIVNPAFSVAMIRLNFEIVDDYTRKFIEDIKSEGNETLQSVLILFRKLTLSIICGMTLNILTFIILPTFQKDLTRRGDQCINCRFLFWFTSRLHFF